MKAPVPPFQEVRSEHPPNLPQNNFPLTKHFVDANCFIVPHWNHIVCTVSPTHKIQSKNSIHFLFTPPILTPIPSINPPQNNNNHIFISSEDHSSINKQPTTPPDLPDVPSLIHSSHPTKSERQFDPSKHGWVTLGNSFVYLRPRQQRQSWKVPRRVVPRQKMWIVLVQVQVARQRLPRCCWVWFLVRQRVRNLRKRWRLLRRVLVRRQVVVRLPWFYLLG
mmetsp:Transcript_1406/g.2286  ORF Transcript_1406/g.2286 Transcript_1406/m.2286 type:complete len:221 (-) Transcript_1406:45-707(-)